jgi:hypothetical protein
MTLSVEGVIAMAKGQPLPKDEKPKPIPNPRAPAEQLSKPAEIVTPTGTRYRFVIPPEGSEGSQAWESDDLLELSGKLFKSLQHANVYIQRQKRELKEVHDLLNSITAYLSSLSQLRDAAANAELGELTRIIHERKR